MVLDVKSFAQVYAQGVIFFNRNIKKYKKKKKLTAHKVFLPFFIFAQQSSFLL